MAVCPPDPGPAPGPPPGAWIPPMAGVQVAMPFSAPDVVLNAGANIASAYAGGARKILLNPGSYGTQSLGSLPAADIWCSTYDGAIFANGGSAFVLPAAGMRIGNLRISNYPPHSSAEEGAMLNFNGVANQWAYNCRVINASNNAYSVKGSSGGIRGGEIIDVDRYGWAGGGADNTFEDLYLQDVGSISESNSGATKTVFSQRHTVRRICGLNMRWNGIWFDIQNQPALIEDIFFDGVGRAVVFLEVSYGGDLQSGVWTHWRVNRVGGANPVNIVRSSETNWPVPAVLQISSTPDINAEDIYGTGWRQGVSLINDQNHPQITGAIGTTDRSRLGLQNIRIHRQNTPGTARAAAAVRGTAATTFPEMRPTTQTGWSDPIWQPGALFEDTGGFITQAAFLAKYPPQAA